MQWNDAISDYCSSEHFLFLDPVIKEHAEALLMEWKFHVGEKIDLPVLESSMQKIARTSLPIDIRKGFPHLLIEFFQFLGDTGRNPQAGEWAQNVELLQTKYLESFRDDGSIKGETFKKKAAEVGRNEPCPCGSGKKFKKCCMPLVE